MTSLSRRHLIVRSAPINWPLWVGLGLLVVVAYLALYGSTLAPRDPLQENFIVQNTRTGKFVKPPLPAFTVPGFPLGSDEFGRDVLSQLLWAVRPTLTLVLVVAALRLTLGTLIGLLSGWSAGWRGRLLDGLISAGLAAPVLFVALCLIAAVGQRWGIWAFVAGLSVTGWAEAARLVREQTRGIKRQPYIEAARALGASGGQILLRHILPQLMPLVWILFSFEASSTLLTSAGLGFLGYFINSIWIPLGDFSGIRASGLPDLGQMLAGVANIQRQPWSTLAAGSLVVITVLGFNLLGEGLRLRWSLERLNRRQNALQHRLNALIEDIEVRWFDPLSTWRRDMTTALALGSLLVVMLSGGWWLYRSQLAPSARAAITVPGDHLWAAEQHDAQGTFWTSAIGPAGEPVVKWVYTHTTSFLGGPAVAANGTLYVVDGDSTVHAISPEGHGLWQTPLPSPAFFGGLGLSELGDIYVVGLQGEVYAVTSEGHLRWAFQPETDFNALSGPIVGPDGTIYYATDVKLVALTVDGNVRWIKNLPLYGYSSPLPRLDASGQYLFFEDVILDAHTGATLFGRSDQPISKYVVGVNGGAYLRTQTALLEWTPTDEGATLSEYAKWDLRSLGLGFRFPNDAGVLPDGRAWVYYASGFEFVKLVWLDASHQPLTPIDYPYRSPARLLGIDGQATTYLCGVAENEALGHAVLECRANAPGSNAPTWKVALDSGQLIATVNAAPVGAAIPRGQSYPVGGAIVPGHVYVATGDGYLYALGTP